MAGAIANPLSNLNLLNPSQFNYVMANLPDEIRDRINEDIAKAPMFDESGVELNGKGDDRHAVKDAVCQDEDERQTSKNGEMTVTVTENAGVTVEADPVHIDKEEDLQQGQSRHAKYVNSDKQIKAMDEAMKLIMQGRGQYGNKLRKASLLHTSAHRRYLDKEFRELVQVVMDFMWNWGSDNNADPETSVPSQKAITQIGGTILGTYGRRFSSSQRNTFIMKLAGRKTYMLNFINEEKKNEGIEARKARKHRDFTGEEVLVGGPNPKLDPPLPLYEEEADQILEESSCPMLKRDLDGILQPEEEHSTEVSDYCKHFRNKKKNDKLSLNDLSNVCKSWCRVNQHLRDTDKVTYLRLRELPLFRNMQLLDAHVSVLFDQRLSLGTLRPFKRRVSLYVSLMGHIFGNTPQTGRKRVEDLKKTWTNGKLTDELVFVLLFIQHFKETTRAIQMARQGPQEDGIMDAVVNAQTPIVLIGVYDDKGIVFKYDVYVSGEEAFSTADGEEAIFLFLTSFFIFHVSTMGTSQQSAGDLENLPPVPDNVLESEDESDGGSSTGAQEGEGEEVCRMGQSNVIRKRKGEMSKARKGKRVRRPTWKAMKEINTRPDAYDLSLSVHVMAKVLLNVSNSYSSTHTRSAVQSAKCLVNKFLRYRGLLQNMQEKNNNSNAPLDLAAE